MVSVTAALKQRMLGAGISTLHHPPFGLPSDCTFEPPCSMKWMAVAHSLKLGAFSYAVSGYYFNVEIKRYTSIGESVQIGRGSHPTSWGSTSPLFYQQHKHVFNFDCPEAVAFKTNAPHVGMKRTLIGNDVYIGHGAFIMQGVEVGDGAVIGAGSVVTKDVPSYSVVAGSPAAVRKMRFDNPTIRRMQELRWWQYAFWDLSEIPASDPTKFLDFVERRTEEGLVPYRPRVVTISELEDTEQQ